MHQILMYNRGFKSDTGGGRRIKSSGSSVEHSAFQDKLGYMGSYLNPSNPSKTKTKTQPDAELAQAYFHKYEIKNRSLIGHPTGYTIPNDQLLRYTYN